MGLLALPAAERSAPLFLLRNHQGLMCLCQEPRIEPLLVPEPREVHLDPGEHPLPDQLDHVRLEVGHLHLEQLIELGRYTGVVPVAR